MDNQNGYLYYLEGSGLSGINSRDVVVLGKDKYTIEKKGSKCKNHHKKLIVYYYKHFKLFSKIGGFISLQKQIKIKAKTCKFNDQCTT